MKQRMRLLLVDDHDLFRSGLCGLIGRQDDMEVAGEARDGQEALEKARELMPDLILMDIQMPGCDGLRAVELIKREMPYVRIVMLTICADDGDLFEAIKRGADGYITKDVGAEELFDLLRAARYGEAAISGATAARILVEFSRLAKDQKWDDASEPHLSPRETEVLRCVARGAMNKEIAAQLYISENTVKNHLRNILAKLHLGNRVQAAAYAHRMGLAGTAPGKGVR